MYPHLLLLYGISLARHCAAAPSLSAHKHSIDAAPKPPSATPQRGPIFGYLAFGKVGSTSFRHALAQRELLHNRTSHGVFYSNLICDTWHDRLATHGCADIEDYAAVNVAAYNGFHFCEKQSPRPCRYFTLLRNPVNRLKSAFSYFCTSCEENGRQCDGGFDVRQYAGMLTCPNMTFLDYAGAFQSVYTRAFASHADPPQGEHETAVDAADRASAHWCSSRARSLGRRSCSGWRGGWETLSSSSGSRSSR